MAVEMVILAPVMLAFALLVHTGSNAAAAADRVAAVAVEHPERCAPAELTGEFVPGNTITVTVTCDVSYAGLGLLGLPGSKRVSASSSAPLDTYTNREPG
jgi:hypothetical protein